MLPTFVALVQDKPGVLTRVASLWSRHFVVIAILVGVEAISAQTIHVRILDQKNGKQLFGKHLDLIYLQPDGPPTAPEHIPVTILRDGYAANIDEKMGSRALWLKVAGIRNGAGTGWDDYVVCWQEGGYAVRISDILSSGIVSPNNCNSKTAQAEPGELVLFVRHVPWWQKID